MQEINGNMWTYHNQGQWIIVTTNNAIKKNGAAVMGRGIAGELSIRYPDFPVCWVQAFFHPVTMSTRLPNTGLLLSRLKLAGERKQTWC